MLPKPLKIVKNYSVLLMTIKLMVFIVYYGGTVTFTLQLDHKVMYIIVSYCIAFTYSVKDIYFFCHCNVVAAFNTFQQVFCQFFCSSVLVFFNGRTAKYVYILYIYVYIHLSCSFL